MSYKNNNNNNNNNITRVIEAETYDQRLESMYEFQDKNHAWPNIIAVHTHPEGSYYLKEWYPNKNLITNAGKLYYAQLGAGATPTNDFKGANGRCILRNQADTPNVADTYTNVLGPITASNKGHFTGYPKVNDLDGDNTGKGTDIVTYKFNWGVTDFSDGAIQGGCIHNGGNTPGGDLLNHFDLVSFSKTTSDTLTLYCNHDFSP